MKKAISIQSIILFFAMSIAFALTIYVGNYAENASKFYWNTFLVNITFMGDAFCAFGLVLFLLFFYNKKSNVSFLLIAILISLTLTQFIKNIFNGTGAHLFFEEGVLQNPSDVIFNNNIISSHAAIAFTLAGFFILKSKKIFLRIVCILLACLVAFTRIELAGDSLITLFAGLLPAAAAVIWLYKMKYKRAASINAYYFKYFRSRKENWITTIFRRVTLFLQAM